MGVYLNDSFRRQKFDEYTELEYKIRVLKAIIQNPVPLTDNDISEHNEFTNEVVNKLMSLAKDIQYEFCKVGKR